MTNGLARLDAGRDLQLDPFAVDAGDHDAAAQCRGGEGDRRLRDQGRAVAPEDRVTLHMDEEVEIAWRRTAHSRFAFAGNADAGAFVDAGGDVDVELAGLERAPLTFASVAGIGDGLAGTHTTRAGPFDHEEALLGADLASAATGRAALGRRLPAGAR